MSACIALDYFAIERFFRSVALAYCTQMSLQSRWVEYKDSAVLNVAYTIFFWKEGPGHFEVDVKSAHELEREIEKKTTEFVETFMRKLHEQGFSAAEQYVKAMGQLKANANAAVQQAFKDASDINTQVIERTNEAIRRAAAIKLTAGVGVAVLGATVGILAVGGAVATTTLGGVALGANPLVFAGVGTANTVTHTIIKSWDKGGTAKAVAMDMGKAGGQESAGKVAEVVGASTRAGAKAASTARQNAEVMVNRYSQMLGRRSTNAANLAKRTRNLTQAQQQLSTTTRAATAATAKSMLAKTVGFALPVVFAGMDIMSEVEDYRKTVKGTH